MILSEAVGRSPVMRTSRSICAALSVALASSACAPGEDGEVIGARTDGITSGVPLDPTTHPAPGTWSPQVREAFVLLADANNSKLIYYVPRHGAVVVQSPLSQSPLPRFQVFGIVPSYGFFAGQELGVVGGSLSTSGDLGATQLLSNEASKQGFTISPAPARTAVTTFSSAGYVLPDGRIDVQCTTEDVHIVDSQGHDRIIKMPKCFTRQKPDQPYEIDTNVMYRFTSSPVLGNSVVTQSLSFQGVVTPTYTPELRTLMATGGQWDSVLHADVEWKIKTGEPTLQARFHINWQQVFVQASSYCGTHFWILVDRDVKSFFESLVACSKENECGIRVEFLQADGSWGPTAPPNANFANLVQAVYDQLSRELFNKVDAYSFGGGSVSSSHNAIFTMRSNYEKQILSVNEVRYFTWNPGASEFAVQTKLDIGCLKGGFESGRVSWDMDTAECRAILGRE